MKARQIIVESTTNNSFSDRGDSGSLVINDQNQVIGLLFAGDGNITICNRILDVVNELDISIDHGVTLHDMHASLILLHD